MNIHSEKIYFLPFYHRTDESPPVKEKTDVAPFFKNHFMRDFALVTPDGRTAISIVLQSLGLKREDEVCIVTTFDYPNVSSCVTSTVFNFCKPSRVMSAATKAVIVIHEFGVPYARMKELLQECRDKNIPLIEDCAHTIDSVHDGVRVGTSGDWVIGSLPKIFPVPLGGILAGKPLDYKPAPHETSTISALCDDVAPYLSDVASFSSSRRKFFRRLTEDAKRLGLSCVYEVTDNITPWFFPVHVPDARAMMDAVNEAGVDCALWHGTDIVVFPCHQYLTENHIKRMAEAMKKGMEFHSDH